MSLSLAMLDLSVPSFCYTGRGLGQSSFRVGGGRGATALPFSLGGQTLIEDTENLSSYLVRGCRNGLNGDTKRGERMMRFLCIVSPILNFLHSHDDCFAALQLILSRFISWRRFHRNRADACVPFGFGFRRIFPPKRFRVSSAHPPFPFRLTSRPPNGRSACCLHDG